MTSSLVFADDDEGVSLESCAQPEKAVTDKAAISAFFYSHNKSIQTELAGCREPWR